MVNASSTILSYLTFSIFWVTLSAINLLIYQKINFILITMNKKNLKNFKDKKIKYDFYTIKNINNKKNCIFI